MVPLPEGFTRQIKGLSLLGDYDFLTGGNKVFPCRDKVLSDKILIIILVKEIVLYTGKSPLETPLIL